MTWQTKTREVLDKYYMDEDAKIVCVACLNRFKAVESAVTGSGEAGEEVMAMMINDYVFLPSNPFWQQHGGQISVVVASRFFDWLKAHKMLEDNKRTPSNMHQAVQADGLRQSFIGVADLILRLHIPFGQYVAASSQLHNDLAAIEEL